jgi:hypothetical protein
LSPTQSSPSDVRRKECTGITRLPSGEKEARPFTERKCSDAVRLEACARAVKQANEARGAGTAVTEKEGKEIMSGLAGTPAPRRKCKPQTPLGSRAFGLA